MTRQLNFKNDPETRALAAYNRSPLPRGGSRMQPSLPLERVKVDGKDYIRLTNVRGTLAVYEVRANGSLKGLQEWPAEIDD